MQFQTTYLDHLEAISEGKFKGLAAAGLLAVAGAPQMASGATIDKQPSHKVYAVQSVPDSVIIRSIIDFTKQAEESGRAKLKAYKCPTGHMTIGFGTNIEEPHNARVLSKLGYDIKRVLNGSQQITEKDAEILLQHGMQQALNDAREYLPNFDSQPLKVKGILVDMSYNLGLTKLKKFEEMRSGLLARDYEYAKEHMIRSKWYKQVGNRSRKLVSMMDDVIRMEK